LSGDIYFGQHNEWAKEGQGKMIYFNGSVYEGGWLNDLKHFKGKMIDSSTGDVFSGEYLDGKRNGKGKMYYH
jgi:hypothetical protein